VYRFYSPFLHSHFYTAGEDEALAVIENYPDTWIFETVAFYALPADDVPDAQPVYRFWSPLLGEHFYTIRAGEANKLTEQFPDIWIPEGIAFYAFPESSPPADTEPVYRFYNRHSGTHFYTGSVGEKDKLLNNFSDVWVLEGIAWCAYPPVSAVR